MSTAGRSSAWVEVHEEPETLVLRVGGEVDMAGRDAVEPALMAALPTADTVVVDLGDLTFCDSTGISMFVAANEKAQAHGTVLKFRNLAPNVARVFEISGISRLLAITE